VRSAEYKCHEGSAAYLQAIELMNKSIKAEAKRRNALLHMQAFYDAQKNKARLTSGELRAPVAYAPP